MATTFRFTAMSDPSLLARATDLQTCGTLQDVPSLTGFLGHADPTLKASACAALAAIAQRTDSSAGEAGRTLKDARQRLTDLARLDGDDTVRAAASVAVAAVAAGTSYLPAWPMPEPSPSLKRPPSGATTPLTDHAGHAAPSFAATSVPPAPALMAPPSTSSAAASSSSSSSGAPAPSEWRAKKSRTTAPTAKELKVRARDGPLFTALCELRQRLAKAEGKGQHIIASNEVLAALAAARPKAYAQLMSVKGIGKQKADAYGTQFLQCIREHPPDAALDAAAAEAEAEAEAKARAEVTCADLSAEQMRATDLVRNGHNVFLTGGAGTGKSYTLKVIIDTLKLAHGTEHVFVTASTGIAACAIGGTTVHSWAGIGLGRDSASELASKIDSKPQVKRRWDMCRALVIDEVSMLDGSLFDKLDAVARLVRGAKMRPATHDPAAEPFAGIQLVRAALTTLAAGPRSAPHTLALTVSLRGSPVLHPARAPCRPVAIGPLRRLLPAASHRHGEGLVGQVPLRGRRVAHRGAAARHPHASLPTA